MARNIFWSVVGMACAVLLNAWGIGPNRLKDMINTDVAAEIAGEVGDQLKDIARKRKPD